MANDINNVILIGRITRDPEFKTVGQTSLANFSLANNRSYFDCVVWGKLAEVLKQYAGKGKQLMVEGRLEQSTWDGQDGKKQSKIRIRVENFQLLGGRPNSESQSSPEAAHSSLPSQTHFTPDIDEIPAEDIF